MPAVVTHQFKKGFILKQEHIVKLDEIIRNRLKELGIDSSISYKVYRADSITYDTKNYEDIINEENSHRNKILNLDISSQSENLTIKLSFNNDGVNVYIEANNKKDAILIFSDIKSYIETEVATVRIYKNIRKILIFCSGIGLAIAISLLLINNNINSVLESPLKALEGGIEEKLNYLILEKIPRYKNEYTTLCVMFVSMIFIIAAIISDFIIVFIQRKNIFCWGKMENSYEKFLKIRSHIFWGIFICFIIGIIASVLANIISKNLA